MAVCVYGGFQVVQERGHLGVFLRLAEGVDIAVGILLRNNREGSHDELVVAISSGHDKDDTFVFALEISGVYADNLGCSDRQGRFRPRFKKEADTVESWSTQQLLTRHYLLQDPKASIVV